MSDYPFHAGPVIDRQALRRAANCTGGAYAQLIAAETYDGRNLVKRDNAIREAREALLEALAALDAIITPPPVPPAVAARADIVALMHEACRPFAERPNA